MDIGKFVNRLRFYSPIPFFFISQLYHFMCFSLAESKTQLENAMFITSIDIDVGSKELGVINKGKNDLNVSGYMSEYTVGKIEESALPLFVDLVNDFEISVTFAVRGQLAEVNGSALQYLLQSSFKHDIGSHGYYHRSFQELSRFQAESELKMLSTGMKRFGITPKSFVFPINRVGHLNLLEKYGYKCYREAPSFLKEQRHIEKQGRLYRIPSGLMLDRGTNLTFLKIFLDISIVKKLAFHLWFHLWNFGKTNEVIQKNLERRLVPFLEYAKKKVNDGALTFETMLSAAEKIEELNK